MTSSPDGRCSSSLGLAPARCHDCRPRARTFRPASGRPATIVGTAGNDVLRGTDGPDVIWAGAGYDDVKAYGGDDLDLPG